MTSGWEDRVREFIGLICFLFISICFNFYYANFSTKICVFYGVSLMSSGSNEISSMGKWIIKRLFVFLLKGSWQFSFYVLWFFVLVSVDKSLRRDLINLQGCLEWGANWAWFERRRNTFLHNSIQAINLSGSDGRMSSDVSRHDVIISQFFIFRTFDFKSSF